MINECDKRYIIFKIFFTLIQGLLPATFIIIMQKIINLIQKKQMLEKYCFIHACI